MQLQIAMRHLLLLAALLAWMSGEALAQVSPPAPPQPNVCTGGNSFTGYAAYGAKPDCGTALSTGAINSGGPQAIGIYPGAGAGTTIGPGTLQSGLTLSAAQLGWNSSIIAPIASPVFTGNPTGPTPATADNSVSLATTAYVKASGFTLGSTAITNGSGTVGTIAGLTLTAPTINGGALSGTITGAPTFSGGPTITGGTFNSPTISAPTITGTASLVNANVSGTMSAAGIASTTLTNAPLLGTDLSGNLRAITPGTGLSLSGTTLNATGGGGGGGFTPPAANTLMISNGTTSPSGLAPINNDLLYATGGSWTPLTAAASSVPCWSASSVMTACSSATMQSLLGYLTANQSISLGGDASGSGTTSITVTNNKINGVAVPASPAANTVLAATSSNQGTWETGAGLAALTGFGDMLTQSHTNVSITGGAITLTAGPTNALDAATKGYVDAAVTGAVLHTQVMAATAAALPNTPVVASGTGVGKTLTAAANAALVIDGYTVLLNDRVLVKNQAAGSDNGIYTQTTLGVGGSVKWVLTRATDFDQAAVGEVALGAYVFVTNGTANGGSQWQLGAPTPAVITVDTTALTFNKLNAPSLSADGTTILNTGGVLSVISSGALDVITSTRGSLLERGVSGWAGIPPVATVGFVLTNNGTGTDPTFQAPATGLSGMTSTQLGIAGSASTITSSIAYSNVSSANKIGQLNASGLWDPAMLPLATAAAFGAVKCGPGTTCTAGTITAASGADTVTTGIAAAGTTLAAATSLTTQQNYVASGANCTTPQTSCAGTAAVSIATALMTAGNHIYVTNEDPVNALLVYPDTTGHTINSQAAGVGITVQANQTAQLIVKSTTALRTVP